MPIPADDPDALLLRRFLSDGSEAAFRALAGRWLPLVWSTARRVLNGDDALAEDVAQQVLADFAQKAHRLPPQMPAGGWLHRHTVFTASKTVRSERRRRARELTAAADAPMTAEAAETWRDTAPHLDAALDRLPATDRAALVLRYYEERGLRDVGLALGISEEAARKRIDRALEKLRRRLAGTCPLLTLTLLGGLLRDEATAGVPAGGRQNLLSGAWGMAKYSTAPVVAKPWWRGRLAKAAAALVTAGLFAWFLWNLYAPAEPNAPSERHPTRASSAMTGKPSPPGHGSPRTLTATLITLPEAPFTLRMLSYTPGEDDAALYKELLAQAESAQRLIKPDEALASTGHPLVVLSAELTPRPLPVPPEPRKAPPADTFGGSPADPFAVGGSDGSDQSDASAPFASYSWQSPPECAESHAEYPWSTKFAPNPGNGHILGGSTEHRTLGTTLAAMISPAETEDHHTAWCKVEHHFAAPEEMDFSYWPESENVPGEPRLTQPVFRSLEMESFIPLRAGGGPVLAAMQTISAEHLPESDPAPRRVFLFLSLTP